VSGCRLAMYLFLATAGTIIGGCADRQSESALPSGQRLGPANDAVGGIDPTIRYGSPSGRYGRPSSGSALPTKARENGAR
jgi:hypothetical protein